MAKKKTALFRSKELRDTASVAALFRDLADKLETGELVIQRGEQEVAMSVGDRVALKLKANEKKTKRGILRKLTVGLRWVEGETHEQVTVK